MKPFDDEGRELEAVFTVEDTDDGIVRLIVESRGGSDTDSRSARNKDYAPGLELLLRRLAERKATILDIEVFSRRTQTWGSEDRRVRAPDFPFPIKLSAVTDFTRLRHAIGRASAALGRPPEQVGGNPTKRLRISLDWDDQDILGPGETYSGKLEAILAAAPAPAPMPVPGRREHRASRYDALGVYLGARNDAQVRLTLSEITGILGVDLPLEAGTHQFWANASGHHPSRRRQWLGAGYRAFFEPASKSVVFHRDAPADERPTDDPGELRVRARSAFVKIAALGLGASPPPDGEAAPLKQTGAVMRYVRDPKVVAWVLLQAQGACEVCDHDAPFVDVDGMPFLEVHHVRPLREGGPDQVDNAVAACPNCHRRLHFSADKDAVRTTVIGKVERLMDHAQVR